MPLPYKMLGPENIHNSKLLFWPNNPRLKISDFRNVNYTHSQLTNQKTQKKIWNMLRKNEYEVQKLAKSMMQSGFMREKAPIVLKLSNLDRYLVLEGNRRLTAIRLILSGKDKVSPDIKSSLECIPCWLFELDSDEVPLEAAISRMVAEAHIKGQKAHTKIQQAHMLYDGYMSFLSEKGSEEFHVDSTVMQKGAEFFGHGMKEFEQEVAVFRLFFQLGQLYPKIDHKVREKLTWVYNNPRLFGKYFSYATDTFEIGQQEIESYFDIFLRKGCAVSNPASFKKFINIMRYGDERLVEVLRTHPEQLEELEKSVLADRQDTRFLAELQNIRNRIGRLELISFKNTEEERKEIVEIEKLAKNRLGRLISAHPLIDGDLEEPIDTEPPENIEDAITMPSPDLQSEICRTLESLPNTSCVRSRLPTYLLRKWGIVSRGNPRSMFVEHMEKVLEQMVLEGKVISYTAVNERVRLGRW
jgi:hypothetical protein